MKKVLALLLLIGITFSNCRREYEETEIPIEFEFMDDVSPINTILSVNKDIELHWSEWKINNHPHLINAKKNSLEYIFHDPGISNVKFNASGNNAVNKYFGNLDIDIPEIAEKLIFSGYYFKDKYELNIVDDNLIFWFLLYDGTSYTYDYFTKISRSTIESKDSVSFDTPIIIDLKDIDIMEGENLYIHFIIEGEDSHQHYFKTNFFIKDWYLHHRMYAPNYFYLDNLNNQRIYLNSDWTR